MIWKHSCKSCLRMGWKAALFALLTAMATMFLYLAGNTWLSSERMLRECDEAYTTIAVLEYIGDNYPGETEYDPDMRLQPRPLITDPSPAASMCFPGSRRT